MEQLCPKTIMPGRFLSLNLPRPIRIVPYALKRKVDCCINESHFSELVRLFYYNLSYNHSSFFIHPFVLGKKIVITCQLISNLFSIPIEGKEYFLSSHQPISSLGLDKLMSISLSLVRCHGGDEGHDNLSSFF